MQAQSLRHWLEDAPWDRDEGAWPLGLCSSLCHLSYSVTYFISLLLSCCHGTLGKLKELGGARENFPPGNNE